MSTAIPAKFPLKGTMVPVANDKVCIKWEFAPEDLEKFATLARMAKNVMEAPPSVFDMLYADMIVAAQKDKLLVSPQQPEVAAHHQQHGEDKNIQFFTGPGFFQAELHKYSTYYMFSLFNAPGALGALDMQLKQYKVAASQTPETSEERASRMVGGLMEMLAQLDQRRSVPPTADEDVPPMTDDTNTVDTVVFEESVE